MSKSNLELTRDWTTGSLFVVGLESMEKFKKK